MIPWFPLPIYQQGLTVRRQQIEVKLPEIQQTPPAPTIVSDNSTLPKGYGYGDNGELAWYGGPVIYDSVNITVSRDRVLEFIYEMNRRTPAIKATIGVTIAAGALGGLVGAGGLYAYSALSGSGAGITTLGILSRVSGPATATITTTQQLSQRAKEVEAVIERGLANPITRGLAKQLLDHQRKLLQYIKDPLSMDNKGFLRNAPTQEIRDEIYKTRIQSLIHQIKNFYEQITTKLPK